MKPPLLLTTGPVPISESVSSILSQPMQYHRDKKFVLLFNQVLENLKYFLQTSYDVFVHSASGTGGMEAVVANFFSRGDRVIVVENGKFSERWSQIAKVYGLQVSRVKIPWGQSIQPEQLKEEVKRVPDAKGIFLTHCESSTGALTDVGTLVPAIRDLTPALVIVDAISSAGIIPLKMDAWQIDVVVTASQKGLGLPPGLAIVALNDRAWQRSEMADLPRFYFDFMRARQAWLLGRGGAFTPAIPLIAAAAHVLDEIVNLGLERIWEQRRAMASKFRGAMNDLELSIFPAQPADGMTVVQIDHPLQAKKIIARLRDDYHIFVSGGQGQLQDLVLRIGHMVEVSEEQLHQFVTALETILSEAK
ncbi:MAG: pyridoxal-phosphate-dependent aminotransferase family protein [Candidatus Zhuqueibacterota bacterium]